MPLWAVLERKEGQNGTACVNRAGSWGQAIHHLTGGRVRAAGKALWFFFAIHPFLSLSKGVSGAMLSQLAYWACDPEANGQTDHFHLLVPEMRNTDSFPRQVTEIQTGNHQELLGKKPIAAVQMATLGGAIVGKPSLPLLEVSAGFSHPEVHPLREKKQSFCEYMVK